MPNITRCNSCAVHNCTKWTTRKIGPGQWENIPLIEDSSGCTSYIKSASLKTSVLSQLVLDKNKNKALTKLLSLFNFRIQEINKYPFFRLLIRR